MSEPNALQRMLSERSLKRGSFTLASGRTSDIYIDVRLTTLSPEGMRLIGPLACQAMREKQWNVNSIGGLTMGADPIACAMSYASMDYPPPLRAFTVRKEVKSHGARRLIEGPFYPGDHVVIVEDVITTGASALRAAEAVQKEGGIISGVLAVVDREEGGRSQVEAAGFETIVLVAVSDLLRR